ncbi:MAG: AMP-binding protein, partial [Halolamina sp.]
MTGRRTGTERGRPALGASTLSQTFEESADRHAGGVAQLYKGGVADRSLVADGIVDPAPPGEFAALSYGRLRGLVRTLAAGFRDLGVAADDRVGIFARTRMEWAQCDLGVLAAGAVVTTLSPTASTEQVRRLR